MKDIIALLEKEIGPDGSLRLEPEQAKLLIRWLNSVDQTFEKQGDLVVDMQKFVKQVCGRFAGSDEGET